MNDPHIKALNYRIKHADHVDFDQASPLPHEEPSFSIYIEKGQAKITMKDHYPTREAARAEVDPFLRAWELKATLDFDATDKFEFVFENAEIVDRMPTHGALCAQGFADGDGFASADAHSQRSKYPDPPVRLVVDGNVDLMLYCYRMYREDRRGLAEVAYFCLTVLEHSAGGRKPAAQSFGIALPVLSKLALLSSEKGGRAARKAIGAQSEFTDKERAWLEAVMKVIIRRASEVAFDRKANQKPITLADLPPLL